MDTVSLAVLRALDLHQARTLDDVVVTSGLPAEDVSESLADLARPLARSPRVWLLKPAGRQRLRR